MTERVLLMLGGFNGLWFIVIAGWLSLVVKAQRFMMQQLGDIHRELCGHTRVQRDEH